MTTFASVESTAAHLHKGVDCSTQGDRCGRGGGRKKFLKLFVVRGDGPSLLGRDWLMQLRLDWKQVHVVRSNSSQLDATLKRHSEVFKDELGTIRGIKAKIQIQADAQPRYYRPRVVPYALRGKVAFALERLEEEGIIEPVQHSNWAAPIVPVVKRDGSIRACGDYKLTVNQVAKRDTFPLPRIQDIFASLEGGKTFSKLDLAQAYLQVPLEENSKTLVTINSPKRLRSTINFPKNHGDLVARNRSH